MPAGTPAAGVLAASRAFAREEFALKHRYAMVLHTDQPHPHVHLVVKAMSEQGGRLNIRKETLQDWRRQFASHLRAQGIEANATKRVVRGVVNPRKRDGVYQALRAGRSSHMRARAESVSAELGAGSLSVEPAKARILDARRRVVHGWLGVRDALRAEGDEQLARDAERFVRRMPPPQTEREQIAQALQEHLSTRRQEMQRIR